MKIRRFLVIHLLIGLHYGLGYHPRFVLLVLNIITNLIYDDTVLILDDDFPNGHKAVQLKEYLNFGFTYTFSNKK